MDEFYQYIIDNFNISGEVSRLIRNILIYADEEGLSGGDLYLFLSRMLDGAIGLTDAEIKRFS